MSTITALEDLAAIVAPGSTVAIGGFQLSRVPVALLRAVAAHGTDRLHAISAPNPLGLDILAAGGCLRSVDCGFIGFQFEAGFHIPPALKRAVAAGEGALRQRDVYETIEDLRAAASAREPLADVVLLHAQCADRFGNLEIKDPYVDHLLAGAGRTVLATAEVLVERLDAPTLTADRVDGVAIVPAGASPAACHGYYARNVGALETYLGLARPAGRHVVAADGQDHEPDVTSARPGDHRADAPRTFAAHEEAVDAFLVDLARQVRDGETVVTGLASAVPMLAIALAQRTHAPRARYINCIGAVNPRIDSALPSSVDPKLLVGCEDTIDLPDLFDLARDGGVDSMFFGAGQVDAFGNINLSHIGPAEAPDVRLPGPAGSPSMRSFVRRVLISVPRQSARNLVASVDAATSTPARRNKETVMVTDLATWRLTNDGFAPATLRPGTTPAELSSRTGFAYSAISPTEARPPEEHERAALQDIDPAGRRFRLLPSKTPNRNPRKSPERVLHER